VRRLLALAVREPGGILINGEWGIGNSREEHGRPGVAPSDLSDPSDPSDQPNPTDPSD